MNPKHLSAFIIIPILKYLGLYSKEAARLILFTSAQETLCGRYLRQVGLKNYGPARGIYQCEPATFNDVLSHLKNNKREQLINTLKISALTDLTNLTINIPYATAICRIHYTRIPERLPAYDNIDDMWLYYKTHYNTYLGKATERGFIENIKRTGAMKINFED